MLVFSENFANPTSSQIAVMGFSYFPGCDDPQAYRRQGRVPFEVTLDSLKNKSRTKDADTTIPRVLKVTLLAQMLFSGESL